ncbi:hypothetical protein JXB12_01125 [candidate division KSB1 bacterium]|nr:hypothetical protein [candidate division KSB1 bacterium]
MKKIFIELTKDQEEYLKQVSNICKRDTSDFIREALICLLPLDEYMQIKKDFIVLRDKNCKDIDAAEFERIKKRIDELNASTGNRLKRIGLIKN